MKFRSFLLTTLSLSLYANTTLLSLIDSAHRNEHIESLANRTDAANLYYRATKNSYLPRIDAFGNATLVDRTGGFDAKRSTAAGVKAQMILFDGFKRENALHQHSALHHAALHDLVGEKKAVSLDVIQRYFELQNTLDEIQSNTAMRDRLEAQLVRLEKFRSAGLASEDALMRMRSEHANVVYLLEDLRYRSDLQKGDLAIITNQHISDLKPSEIKEPTALKAEEPDSLKALRYSRDAKVYEAEKSDTGYWPTVSIEDQYGYYDYHNDPIAAMRVHSQNKFTASLTLNLIDFSSASTAKEALAAQAQAQTSELAYAAKEAQNNITMAARSIERSRTLIHAAQSAYDASQKTFDAVTQKYEARIVDYITYLDALHSLTDASNQLGSAKRSLQYAYAAYYYYAGYDPKEFVQ